MLLLCLKPSESFLHHSECQLLKVLPCNAQVIYSDVPYCSPPAAHLTDLLYHTPLCSFPSRHPGLFLAPLTDQLHISHRISALVTHLENVSPRKDFLVCFLISFKPFFFFFHLYHHFSAISLAILSQLFPLTLRYLVSPLYSTFSPAEYIFKILVIVNLPIRM